MATQAKDQILARKTVEQIVDAIENYINPKKHSSISISSPKGEILPPAKEIELILRPYRPIFSHLGIKDLTNPVSLRAVQVELRRFIQTLPETTTQERLEELIDQFREEMAEVAGDPETKTTNIQAVIKEGQERLKNQETSTLNKHIEAQREILADLEKIRQLEFYTAALTKQSMIDRLSQVFPRSQAESMVNGQSKQIESLIHNLTIAGPPPKSADELILRVFHSLESNPVFRLADEVPPLTPSPASSSSPKNTSNLPKNTGVIVKESSIQSTIDSTDNWRVRVARQMASAINPSRTLAPQAQPPSSLPTPQNPQELQVAFELIKARPSPGGGNTSEFREVVRSASQSPKNELISQIITLTTDGEPNKTIKPLINQLSPLLTPNEQASVAEIITTLDKGKTGSRPIKHLESLKDLEPKPIFFSTVKEALVESGISSEEANVTARYLQEATQIAALSNTPLPSTTQEAAQNLGDILTVINLKFDPAIKQRLASNPKVVNSFFNETLATAQLTNLNISSENFAPLLQNKAAIASLVGLPPESDEGTIVHHLMAHYTGLPTSTSSEDLTRASLAQLLTEPTRSRKEMPSIVHSIQTQLSQRGNNLHNNIRHVTQNLPQFIEVRVRYRHSARQRASSMLRSFSPGNLPSKLTRQVLQKYFPELEKLPFGEGKSTLLESALKMGGLEGTEAQTAIKALRIANNPLGFLKNALSPSFKAGFSKISGFLSKGMSSIAQKLAPVISKISATIRPMLVKAGQLLVQAATWISEVAIPALIASAEVWVPILVVVVVIGVVVFVIYVHVRRTKFESAQIVPVAGVGGQGEEGVPVDYTPYEGELEIIPIAGACWPVGGYITQEDGSAHATMPGASAFDIGGNDGATVVTPFAGTVLAAGWSNQGYGLYVMLAASGTRTDTGETVSFTLIFAHFGELKIPPCDPSKPDQPEYQTGCGQSLSAGTVLGTVDNTGNSTGPHLHYESKGVAIRSIVPDGANVKLDDAVSGCGS